MTNIIVVFPKPEDARSIRNFLMRSGYSVAATCTSGTVALQAVDNLNEGIIVCGYRYRDMLYDELFDLMKEGFDALVLASPVYFGGPNGTLCALMDRVCYSLKRFMQFKPAAAIAVCRRGGASAALERMNNYFSMTNMPIASSQYINIIYGHTPGQVAQDEEGLQTMRTLAKNIAWMINKLNDDEHPELERPVRTSFVR